MLIEHKTSDQTRTLTLDYSKSGLYSNLTFFFAHHTQSTAELFSSVHFVVGFFSFL